ncbi:MAG: hypothetical protein AAB388_01145 [Patescibacteria group bacterium]
MKKYLAIYLGTASDTEKNTITPEQEKAMMEEWAKWSGEHAAAIVDPGTPLGKTKKVDATGITDTKNGMVVYTIVQAESHEAAAKIFENHPHVTFFLGTSIEVMECLQMPGI